MDNHKKNFAIQALRRATYKWKGRWTAEKKYKYHGHKNSYICAMCPEGVVHGKKDTQMDHVDPVVDPIEGYKDLETFADRLLVYEDGWQRLCKEHHAEKTKQENSQRTKIPKKIGNTDI